MRVEGLNFRMETKVKLRVMRIGMLDKPTLYNTQWIIQSDKSLCIGLQNQAIVSNLLCHLCCSKGVLKGKR